MLNDCPIELLNIMSIYIDARDRLRWSICEKNTHICRNKERVILSCRLLKPYLSIYERNPIFFNDVDLTETIYEWDTMDVIERRDDTIEYLRLLAETLLDQHGMPIFSYSTSNKYMVKGMYSFRYVVKQHILSPYTWNSPLDESLINNSKCFVSGVYGIRSPSRQLRKIMRSLTLKALIG
jgi:hypothetical protein